MTTAASIWLYFLAAFFAMAAGSSSHNEQRSVFAFCVVVSVALFITAATLQVIE